jgi:hypothetical protein
MAPSASARSIRRNSGLYILAGIPCSKVNANRQAEPGPAAAGSPTSSKPRPVEACTAAITSSSNSLSSRPNAPALALTDFFTTSGDCSILKKP